MWVLFVEAGVAVSLLIFIIWWTLGSTSKKEKAPKKLDDQSKKSD